MAAVRGRPSGLSGSFTPVFQPAYGCHPLAWKRTWQLQPVNGVKATPNPPETDPTSAHAGQASQKLDEAAERALSFYLDPKPQTKKKQPPGQLFTVVDDLDSECLLSNLSETLASANVMLNELAFDLESSPRHFALGIQQMIELSELLAHRALDIVDPR